MRTMKLAGWLVFISVFLPAIAHAEVSDIEWEAVLNKAVIVEKNDGSEVRGELSAYDDGRIVVIRSDGALVTVDRVDVKSVRAQIAAGTRGADEPHASDADPEAGARLGRLLNFNLLGNILGSLMMGGIDLSVEVEYVVTRYFAIGIEPELALVSGGGFAIWGGPLLFPLATAPKGLFIKAYAGYGSFGGYSLLIFMAAVGYHFIWGSFVFAPEVGFQYIWYPGFHWRLNLGFIL